MRWLTRSCLLGLALGLAQQAGASCTGGPSEVQTPDANAVTLFVVSDVATGDFMGYAGEYPNGGGFAVAGATSGLHAADLMCNYFATSPTAFNPKVSVSGKSGQPFFNQNNQGGTVQFMALISTSTIDAIDRFKNAGIDSLNIVDSGEERNCLAKDIGDLFGTTSAGNAYGVNHFFDENGNALASGLRVWTGTGFATGGAGAKTASVPGGRYQPPGSGAVDASKGFCGNWVNEGSTGAAGTLQTVSGDNNGNVWINDPVLTSGVGTASCTLGFGLYCVSAQAFDPMPNPTNPGGNGDPQFIGLQGQSFQVHGMPDEFFNLITAPEFQLNSRFTYLASGQCNYNNTECWTHPGTYVDQLGFMFPGIQIKAVAGPHHKGLRAWVNDEEVAFHTKLRLIATTSSNSSAVVTVRHSHHDTLIVSSSLFTVEVTNSDWFFNFNLVFHAPEILAAGKFMHYIADSRPNMGAVDNRYPAYPMHGLVGQTWKNARYPAKRYYQGEVDDYMLLDHTLFSSQFLFNLYQY